AFCFAPPTHSRPGGFPRHSLGYLKGACSPAFGGPLAASTVKITTDIPFRLDRLPWARWHWIVVIGLGITWILDGLEVTIVGAINPTLSSAQGLNFTPTQTGLAATAYLIGAVIGALGFGYL